MQMAELAHTVRYHGPLPQAELAELARHCGVCVLPSFYEGLPLVLVEAVACGCRLVATALPGVVGELAPHLGEALTVVPLPRLVSVDQPLAADLPAFVAELEAALTAAAAQPPLTTTGYGFEQALAPFGWQAVFTRIERVWNEARAATGPGG